MYIISVEILLHFTLNILLHFESMLLHFATILITFCGVAVIEIKEKKLHFSFVGEGGITNPLKTPSYQVQDHIDGRGTFALKRGQK